MAGPLTRSLRDLDPQSCPDSYRSFLDILKAGGAAAYPTETMYGLGMIGPDPLNEAHLNRMKGRGPTSPLIYLTDSWERCMRFCSDPGGYGHTLATRFWPGPLTIVLPARKGPGSLGFRHPDLPAVVRWVRDLDSPISSTSANHTGKPPALTEHELLSAFGRDLDTIVFDGDFTAHGPPSTIVRVEQNGWSILREGSISEAMLRGP